MWFLKLLFLGYKPRNGKPKKSRLNHLVYSLKDWGNEFKATISLSEKERLKILGEAMDFISWGTPEIKLTKHPIWSME